MSFNYDHYKPQSLFSLEGRTAVVTGGGTGIGLSVTRSLIERMGGTLSITSRDGEGTSVTVVLPASRLLPQASTSANTSAA